MASRARLLDCALDELERSGVEAFSLRATGSAAGLSPMAVYRHFRNREDLLAATGEAAFAAWKARLEGIDSPQPIAWLREAARAYLDFALDQPARFEACFVLRTSIERRYPGDFRAGKSPAVSLVVERIEQAQAQGLLDESEPLETAMLFWGQVHGLAMLQRSGRFAMDRGDYLSLCERLIERLLAGMGHKG